MSKQSRGIEAQNSAKARPEVDLRARVAEVAYALFEKRGFQHGRDAEDWVEAERIVIGELQEDRAS
jgi:hypothetical protein